MSELNQNDKVVTILEAEDEMQCRMIAALLAQDGIDYLINSNQVSMFDGVMTGVKGYWGRLQVLASEAERAKKLIADFLAAQPIEPEEQDEPPEADLPEE